MRDLVFHNPLLTREAFCVHIIFPQNDLQKFTCHSVMSPLCVAKQRVASKERFLTRCNYPLN